MPCPDGIDALLSSCVGKLLAEEGDRCECRFPEGNPPPPPREVACPPTEK